MYHFDLDERLQHQWWVDWGIQLSFGHHPTTLQSSSIERFSKVRTSSESNDCTYWGPHSNATNLSNEMDLNPCHPVIWKRLGVNKWSMDGAHIPLLALSYSPKTTPSIEPSLARQMEQARYEGDMISLRIKSSLNSLANQYIWQTNLCTKCFLFVQQPIFTLQSWAWQ